MSVIKKIFFLSLFSLIISLIFLGVYNLAFKSPKVSAPVAVNNSVPVENKTAPVETKPSAISLVSNDIMISSVMASDQNFIYYFSPADGGAYQIDFYGKSKKEISPVKISNLADASWSVDKTKAIVKIKNSENSYSFSYIDLVSGKTIPLKNNLDQVVWQNNANRILYKYYDSKTKERTLNVADPDGGNWMKIADLAYRDLSIAQIPKTGIISFWNSGDAYDSTFFQSVPLVGGESKMLFQNGYGADYLWNNSGDWALVSKTNEKGGGKMELGIINSNGGEFKNLMIPSFVSKCVWSKDGKIVFFALPGEIPDNSVLPNDYKSGKFFTADTFWKIDITTGEKTRLMEAKEINGSYDASQMFLNSSESLLFFVNKADGKLYKITL